MQEVPETSLPTNTTEETSSTSVLQLFSSATNDNIMSHSGSTKTAKSQSSKEPVNDDAYDDVSTVMRTPWDPLHCADWDIQPLSATCIARLKRDISNAFKDPPPGMFITPDPDNITKIHALVVGPFDTPYEGGFFYFILRCPPDYPIRAPRCRLMTTGNNTVRFNPNLYRNGKVCLSILGTWSGPPWSPAQCISSLLISIQSLMSENPYHNEPGYEQERVTGQSKSYNQIITHETIRVAVCEMLENPNSCPKQLYEVICKQFFSFYDYYIDVCTKNADKNGQSMEDPFGDRRGQFEYSSLLTRLNKLKSKLESNPSISEEQPMDSRTRGIIDDATAVYSNMPKSNDVDMDDIFDVDDEDKDEDNDDDDNNIEENP